MYTNSCNKILEIEKLRSKLLVSGVENGLTHLVTIELSQKLDRLLNEYKPAEITSSTYYKSFQQRR